VRNFGLARLRVLMQLGKVLRNVEEFMGHRSQHVPLSSTTFVPSFFFGCRRSCGQVGLLFLGGHISLLDPACWHWHLLAPFRLRGHMAHALGSVGGIVRLVELR